MARRKTTTKLPARTSPAGTVKSGLWKECSSSGAPHYPTSLHLRPSPRTPLLRATAPLREPPPKPLPCGPCGPWLTSRIGAPQALVTRLQPTFQQPRPPDAYSRRGLSPSRPPHRCVQYSASPRLPSKETPSLQGPMHTKTSSGNQGPETGADRGHGTPRPTARLTSPRSVVA